MLFEALASDLGVEWFTVDAKDKAEAAAIAVRAKDRMREYADSKTVVAVREYHSFLKWPPVLFEVTGSIKYEAEVLNG
jgi:hypothetical protein